MRASVPKEPSAAAPKPTPAITVPTPAGGAACASTPINVTTVPGASSPAAVVITRSVGSARIRKAVTAPVPHSSVTTRPPTT